MYVIVSEVKMKRILISTLILSIFSVWANMEYSVHSGPLTIGFESYKHGRQARDVTGKESKSEAAVTASVPTTVYNTTTTAATSKLSVNKSNASNNTTNGAPKCILPIAAGLIRPPEVSASSANTHHSDTALSRGPASQEAPLGQQCTPALHETVPTLTTLEVNHPQLFGGNGSGIRHVNMTENKPKVSDPILDDINSEVFKETPETIQAEQNIKNLTIDNHEFYNSSFIGNLTYFQEYWANITKHEATVHEVLSNSHRRATSVQLKFGFPFYGHEVWNITVATGGFVYTGDVVHNWLAATQYISPLMANFDTGLTNDSLIKMYDDAHRFTVFWENATLQEMPTKKFTFAVTLYENGDIVFAYKDIPIPVQNIIDEEHPVKVGISDAYLNDKILFYVRRKTVYEYHRVNFKNRAISNNTLLKLTALPTCLPYNTCESCVNHDTGFNCTWCANLQKCSSGNDRNKQDWELRHCNANNITKEASCAIATTGHVSKDNSNTAYTTDTKGNSNIDSITNIHSDENKAHDVHMEPVSAPVVQASSPLGGVVAAFASLALVSGLVAWLVYAFKNPHTRSGQLLIKYRPSQWGWRRGEARYTAATIHM